MKNPDPKNTAPVGYSTNYQAQADPDLVSDLQAAGVKYSFTGPASPIGGILLSLLPFLLIGAIWYFIYRRMAGGAGMGGSWAASSAWARARPRRSPLSRWE